MTRALLRKNFLFNLIGMVIPIGIALITVPIYVSHIGAPRYGVLAIVWVFLGYFGLFDFGLSRASANALAKLTHASASERKSVLVTSLYLNLLLGAAGGIILFFVGRILLRHLMQLSDSIYMEVESAFPWVAGMLPLALLAGVATGALESRERFFIVNVLNLTGYALGQIIPIACAIFFGPSLGVVIPAAFLARSLSVVLNLACVARIEQLSTLRGFDRSKMGELFGFGAWVSITSIISPLMTSIDQLLVGSTLGAAAVAHYAVPMSLTNRSLTFSSALARTLYPRFSRLALEEALPLAEKSVVSLSYMFGVICAPVIILAAPFLTLWMGADFATQAIPVLEILMMGAWINGVALIPYTYLEGQGRPDLVAKLHVLEVVPFIIALWFLLQRFGLYGAAAAWSGRVAIDAALLLTVARLRINHLLRIFPAALFIVVSFAVAQIPGLSILTLTSLAALSFVVFAVCAITFDATLRRLLHTLCTRLIEAAI
jgi:O-antigen/teichoic acid export membrane protein